MKTSTNKLAVGKRKIISLNARSQLLQQETELKASLQEAREREREEGREDTLKKIDPQP